jgi:hypothetical protein
MERLHIRLVLLGSAAALSYLLLVLIPFIAVTRTNTDLADAGVLASSR